MTKDIAGSAEDSLELDEAACAQSVLDHYAARFPRFKQIEASLVLARNHEFIPRATLLADGDEIAFLPPVSGGAGPFTHEIVDETSGNFFALTRRPIDTTAIAARLRRDEDGAMVDFQGVVRNHTQGRATLHLDYECYEPMAIKTMAAIGREIAAGFAIGRIAMVHRLGRLRIGETSVAVVVSAPHRRPAFEAALEGINRLKRLVPIWKKEHFAGGEVWVEGEWDSSIVSR